MVLCSYPIYSSANSTDSKSLKNHRYNLLVITATISFWEVLELKRICKSEVHTVLAKNRDAVKNKGFKKCNNEMPEEWKCFHLGRKGLHKWESLFFSFPWGSYCIIAERNPQTNTFELSNTDEKEEKEKTSWLERKYYLSSYLF